MCNTGNAPKTDYTFKIHVLLNELDNPNGTEIDIFKLTQICRLIYPPPPTPYSKPWPPNILNLPTSMLHTEQGLH